MRHTLYRLGWHHEPIGHPRVPKYRNFYDQQDGDHALFFQLRADPLPPLDTSDFLYDKSVHHEPQNHAVEESPLCQEQSFIATNPTGMPGHGLQAEPASIQELLMHGLALTAQIEAVDPQAEPTLEIATWYLDMPHQTSCGEHRFPNHHPGETWRGLSQETQHPLNLVQTHGKRTTATPIVCCKLLASSIELMEGA